MSPTLAPTCQCRIPGPAQFPLAHPMSTLGIPEVCVSHVLVDKVRQFNPLPSTPTPRYPFPSSSSATFAPDTPHGAISSAGHYHTHQAPRPCQESLTFWHEVSQLHYQSRAMGLRVPPLPYRAIGFGSTGMSKSQLPPWLRITSSFPQSKAFVSGSAHCTYFLLPLERVISQQASQPLMKIASQGSAHQRARQV